MPGETNTTNTAENRVDKKPTAQQAIEVTRPTAAAESKINIIQTATAQQQEPDLTLAELGGKATEDRAIELIAQDTKRTRKLYTAGADKEAASKAPAYEPLIRKSWEEHAQRSVDSLWATHFVRDHPDQITTITDADKLAAFVQKHNLSEQDRQSLTRVAEFYKQTHPEEFKPKLEEMPLAASHQEFAAQVKRRLEFNQEVVGVNQTDAQKSTDALVAKAKAYDSGEKLADTEEAFKMLVREIRRNAPTREQMITIQRRQQARGLPALNLEDDPEYKTIYDQELATAKTQIQQSENAQAAVGEDTLTALRNKQASERAYEQFKQANEQKYNLYQQYGVYTRGAGDIPAPYGDPVLNAYKRRSDAYVARGEGTSYDNPASQDLDEFVDKFGEKALLYSSDEAVAAALARKMLRESSLQTAQPRPEALSEASSEQQVNPMNREKATVETYTKSKTNTTRQRMQPPRQRSQRPNQPEITQIGPQTQREKPYTTVLPERDDNVVSIQTGKPINESLPNTQAETTPQPPAKEVAAETTFPIGTAINIDRGSSVETWKVSGFGEKTFKGKTEKCIFFEGGRSLYESELPNLMSSEQPPAEPQDPPDEILLARLIKQKTEFPLSTSFSKPGTELTIAGYGREKNTRGEYIPVVYCESRVSGPGIPILRRIAIDNFKAEISGFQMKQPRAAVA